MTHSVALSDEAEKRLLQMDGPLRGRVTRRLRQLADDPSDHRLSSLLRERPGVRKSRVGDWRILFTVDRETRVIYVATIDTRGQVYRHS